MFNLFKKILKVNTDCSIDVYVKVNRKQNMGFCI